MNSNYYMQIHLFICLIVSVLDTESFYRLINCCVIIRRLQQSNRFLKLSDVERSSAEYFLQPAQE